MKKEYEKFKETLVDTLNTTYAQIPISQANNPDLKASQVTGEAFGKRSLYNSNEGETGIPNS